LRIKAAKHTFKWRETAIENQLKIAQLSLCQDNGRERLGFSSELCLSGQVSGEEILEDAAVR
jgi:hypothetical protein